MYGLYITPFIVVDLVLEYLFLPVNLTSGSSKLVVADSTKSLRKPRGPLGSKKAEDGELSVVTVKESLAGPSFHLIIFQFYIYHHYFYQLLGL